MQLSEQELAGLSETEREALEAEGEFEEATYSGAGPDADDDDDGGAAPDDLSAAAASDGESAGPDKTGTDGAASPKPGDEKAPQGEPTDQPAAEDPETDEQFRPRYVAELPDDFRQQLSDIEKSVADLEQKYRDGDVNFDEFRSQERKLLAKTAELERQMTKAEIAAETAAQASAQEWEWNVKRFMRETTRREGIDYAKDARANKALDSFVKALASDPENAQRDSEWFLAEAHRRTKILLGIGKQDAPAAQASAGTTQGTQQPQGRTKAAAPKVSLGDLPQAGAADPASSGGEFAYLDKLSGIKLEQALAKLTPEKAQQYLEGV